MSNRDNYHNNEPQVQPFNDIQGESIPPPAYTPYEQQQHQQSQQNIYTSPIQTSFPVASIPTSSGYAPPDHPPPRGNSLGGDWLHDARKGLEGRSEDPLLFLSRFDTCFLVDDSGSMAGGLWRSMLSALAGLLEVAINYDPDGIDVYFLNNPATAQNVKNVNSLKSLFDSVQPSGSTPTGTRLEEILLDYLNEYERVTNSGGKVRPLNVIIVTDGTAEDDVETVILNAARRLDGLRAPISQVGIQFIQIGDDPEATVWLHELDNEIYNRDGGCRDIVDTTPAIDIVDGDFDAKYLLKAMLGGINKRYDRANNNAR